MENVLFRQIFKTAKVKNKKTKNQLKVVMVNYKKTKLFSTNHQ